MILRDADANDRQFFFDLRNEAGAVRFSYTKREVTWDEHVRWWDMVDDYLLVAEVNTYDESRKIGYVRLTPLDDSTVELHFAVIPEERGKDWANTLLTNGRTVAADLGYKHIIARVDAPNTASIRAFLREGYQITSAGTLFLERDV